MVALLAVDYARGAVGEREMDAVSTNVLSSHHKR